MASSSPKSTRTTVRSGVQAEEAGSRCIQYNARIKRKETKPENTNKLSFSFYNYKKKRLR